MKSKILLIIISGLFLLFTANSCKKDKLIAPKKINNSYNSNTDSFDRLGDKNKYPIWNINDDEDEPLLDRH